MRVLHVDSGRHWRGGQNQVRLTALGMRARGHEVAIACRRRAPLASRAREERLLVHELALGSEFSLGGALALRRVVRDFRPDVVQAHDPPALTTSLFATAGGRRVPVVATRRVDFAPRSALSRLKYRLSARVIAVSQAVVDVLRRAGLNADRLRLVYEGVPDRQAPSGGAEALAALGVPRGAAVVGNVAALVDHKDHETLIRAAAHVLSARHDVFFVIVGEGRRRSALETLAATLGVGDRVIFAGFRPDVDVLLAAFDIFCLSSHMEGLGTTLLDAMAFARPVVGTAAGGIPEAVEDGVTGRVVPIRDPAALAGALLELLANPVRAQDLGRAGRRRFEERFSAERMVTQTLGVLGEAL